VRSAANIAAITSAEIPVMGRIGITPRSVRCSGGFRVQRDAEKIFEDALATEKAGAFAVVLEYIPVALAHKITAAQDPDHWYRRRGRL
jgi:3-methyl-2-oxobutanoate hydroxymethyltransferase